MIAYSYSPVGIGTVARITAGLFFLLEGLVIAAHVAVPPMAIGVIGIIAGIAFLAGF